MTYQQTLDYLFSTLPMYQRVGAIAYKKDLSNTIKLCSVLDNPHEKFKSVHIAGTNGKGSSAHMIAAVLQTAGYKTGLYTSPHLKNFTERIKINGREIEELAVIDFVEDNKVHLEDIKPSFFETTVSMAFDYFAQEKVDIAIIEVGLGGRLDSTNVITPLVSLITNIGLDHQQMLGESLEEIAREKAGIIKNQIPVVVGQRQDDIAYEFIAIAEDKLAPITFATDNFDIDSLQNFNLDLKGDYQKTNIPGVIETINILNNNDFDITKDHVKKGLENTIALTAIKGRWQVLGTSPMTVCDIAHNEEGVNAVLNQILALQYSKLHIVWGMVNDKDINKILELLPKEADYYFCQPDVPPGMDVHQLEQLAIGEGLKGVTVKDVNQAINRALEQASPDDLVFIGGSTFVVAEIENL